MAKLLAPEQRLKLQDHHPIVDLTPFSESELSGITNDFGNFREEMPESQYRTRGTGAAWAPQTSIT
jgi:hypothetical protein